MIDKQQDILVGYICTLLEKSGVKAAIIDADYVFEGSPEWGDEVPKEYRTRAWEKVEELLEPQVREARRKLLPGTSPVPVSSHVLHAFTKQAGGHRWCLYVLEVIVFEAKAFPLEEFPDGDQDQSR